MLLSPAEYTVVLLIYTLQSISITCLRIDLSINPVNSRIEIDEGDLLEIKCARILKSHVDRIDLEYNPGPLTDEQYILLNAEKIQPKVLYPSLEDNHGYWSNRIFSDTNITTFVDRQNLNFTTILQKKETLHGDTGQYACQFPGSASINKIHISIKSNISCFVEDVISPMPTFVLNTKFKSWKNLTSNQLRLSCQPTSLSHVLEIIKNGKPMNIGVEARWNYTLVLNPSPGSYKCMLRNNGSIVAIKKYIVTEIHEDPVPNIVGDQFIHIMEGQMFRINCTAILGIPISLGWSIRSKGVEQNLTNYVKKYRFRHPKILNYEYIIRELTIQNVSLEHQGMFTCVLKNSKHSPFPIATKSETIQLFVHKNGLKHIKFLPSADQIFNNQSNYFHYS